MSEWRVDPKIVDDYITREDEQEELFTPFLNCGWKSAEDGCCSHPSNLTPECHQYCCPIKAAQQLRALDASPVVTAGDNNHELGLRQ